jgi:hypothetical protein
VIQSLKRAWKWWGAAWLLAACMAAGAADGSGPAHVRLVAYKVATALEAGVPRERLETLQSLRPGDTMEYEATYVNGAAEAMRDVQVTLPVPEGGLVYEPSADTLLASLDGRSFQPVPLMRLQITADGRKLMRRVPLAEYRFLRWDLGHVPAGASRSVRARMTLPALPASTR